MSKTKILNSTDSNLVYNKVRRHNLYTPCTNHGFDNCWIWAEGANGYHYKKSGKVFTKKIKCWKSFRKTQYKLK